MKKIINKILSLVVSILIVGLFVSCEKSASRIDFNEDLKFYNNSSITLNNVEFDYESEAITLDNNILELKFNLSINNKSKK